jgi:hypothetical protein
MRDFALNDKQMEIFRATWPNLGWATKNKEEQLKKHENGIIDTDNSIEEGMV